MASADILRAARARIEDPKNWTKDAYARTAAGDSIGSNSPQATCWCAWGALRAEIQPGSPAYFEALGLLRDASEREFGKGGPEDVNDDLGHAAVLLLFDLAIAAAEAEAGR